MRICWNCLSRDHRLGLGSAVAAVPSVDNVASRCRRPTMSAGLKSSFSRLQGLKFSDITSPLTAVILLSFVLAVGFLLIILSCALWANWLPLLVGVYLVSSQLVDCPYPLLSIQLLSSSLRPFLMPCSRIAARMTSQRIARGPDLSTSEGSSPR